MLNRVIFLALLLTPFTAAAPTRVDDDNVDRVDVEIDENAARFTQCCRENVTGLSPELIDTGVCDYGTLISLLEDAAQPYSGPKLIPPLFDSPVMQEPAIRTAYFKCLSGGRDVSWGLADSTAWTIVWLKVTPCCNHLTMSKFGTGFKG